MFSSVRLLTSQTFRFLNITRVLAVKQQSNSSPNKFIRAFSQAQFPLCQKELPKSVLKEDFRQNIESVNIRKEERIVDITFNNSVQGSLPFLWLRDNCQCSSCFDNIALARNYLLQDLDSKAAPTQVEQDGSTLRVSWNDGHSSIFDAAWLYQRAFHLQAKTNYRDFHRFQREPWGKDVQVEKFSYEDLMVSDSVLLKWLLTMEVKGVALITGTPNDPDAGLDFINHVGFVRRTHYGQRSPVIIRENSNNIAFTNVKLGLHNDLPQYQHQPGLIFLHTVEQHRGQGGESTISDGLLATEILRKEQPKAFDILSKTNVYFWDKGKANLDIESEEFYKIYKAPVIGLNIENQLETMRLNNQVRDSHLDLPSDQVNDFYEAMKILGDVLVANSHSFKMADGEILVLDNVRCLHGREKFGENSSRHLETSYMDWDEALCRRRRILHKMGYVSPSPEGNGN